jgi:lactate dehydrogenase-like 2-hydroxyacid dehydrogenase
VNLHNFLWNGQWSADAKWDLDENLNNTLDNLVLGLVGLGEIGREVTRRLAPMGIKIVYYDIVRNDEFEKKYPNVSFIASMDQIFAEADVVSIHIPLNDKTKGIVGDKLLRKMKPNSLLVNTARGPIVDFTVLISLLKSKQITINLAFDVYDPEPISAEVLKQFQEIAKERPELRFLFIPHNASADADTRAEMATIIMSDLITLVKSKGPEDLRSLRLIPGQKKFKEKETQAELTSFRISTWWK